MIESELLTIGIFLVNFTLKIRHNIGSRTYKIKDLMKKK